MKKVGIILNSTDCRKYLYSTVSELAKSNQVELFFLLNREATTQQGLWLKIWSTLKTRGILRSIDLSLFWFITTLEYKFLSIFFEQIKEHKKIFNIEEFNKNNITYLNPTFVNSGSIVSYEEEEIAQIKSLNLDIIIRGNISGIFKGEILKSAKLGIISFHYGDNRWNRGEPTAFWEVYFRKPSTGFIIQILSEELNGGLVLFRGEISTCRSFTENMVKLFNESNPYLAKTILDYAISGKLPSPEEKLPFGELLLEAPTITKSIKYIFMMGMLFLGLVINRLFLHREKRWGVAYCVGAWRDAILRKGLKIKNPPNRFFADPFVITKNERTICYVEDYFYKQKKGCITAIEIIDNNNYIILGPVIEEPFHMSFPFIFEFNQELFMVPETGESNSIRLYKCIEFPLKWSYQKDILTDCNAFDSMIFEHKKRWWLLTNMATKGNSDVCSQLFAFYSDNPLTNKWIAHDLNPLVFNSLNGRNGGILDVVSKFPVRVRQKQGVNSYGCGLTLARITELTPSSFSEQEIGQIFPNFFPNLNGCHHIHSNGKYTVYDYARNEAVEKEGDDHQ
jgi:hypothetical protein